MGNSQVPTQRNSLQHTGASPKVHSYMMSLYDYVIHTVSLNSLQQTATHKKCN